MNNAKTHVNNLPLKNHLLSLIFWTNSAKIPACLLIHRHFLLLLRSTMYCSKTSFTGAAVLPTRIFGISFSEIEKKMIPARIMWQTNWLN